MAGCLKKFCADFSPQGKADTHDVRSRLANSCQKFVRRSQRRTFEPDAAAQAGRDRSERNTWRGVLPVHRRKACEKEPTSR